MPQSGAAGWNIGVLGEEQRLKARALDLPGQVGDPEAAVIYRSEDAQLHGFLQPRWKSMALPAVTRSREGRAGSLRAG